MDLKKTLASAFDKVMLIVPAFSFLSGKMAALELDS
jgi:hypothetical protein